jgi:hypothetical protein
MIIKALRSKDPLLMTVEMIIEAIQTGERVTLSDRTVRDELKNLITAGYAHRPRGWHQGAQLTPEGMKLAQQRHDQQRDDQQRQNSA